MSQGTSETEGAALRITFVEMLFALAVGQVGIRAADLASMQGNNRVVGLSHLLLALIVIAASWFGWQRSRRHEVERLFSMPFVGLLLDAILVILYFILVQEVDITSVDGVLTISASAYPEALWILIIFVCYVVWDLVTDVFTSTLPPRATFNGTISLWIRASIACTACSLIVAGLTLLVLLASLHSKGIISVLLLDAALLTVVLLFRVLKPVLEPRVVEALRVSACPAFKTVRPTDGNENKWTGALLVVYFVALACAT